MRGLVRKSVFIFANLSCMLLPAAPAFAQQELPAGFSSDDNLTRMYTVEQAGKQKLMMAEGKIAAMAKTDPSAEVRKAACLALADMWASSRVELLKSIAISDPNADVRAAATKAWNIMTGQTGEFGPAGSASIQSSSSEQTGEGSEPERDKYKKPELTYDKKEITTRTFAIGVGTMGGFGIAALDFRGRIKTNAEMLPWVGVELGGGWTPPTGYALAAGPVGKVDNDENKWRIISMAGSILLYLHRSHHIPVRTGWDVGRGLYFMLGYGYEFLNDEGFFSWGAEVGILYQPMIGDKIDNLVSDREPLWPVIPYVRFCLHFYLA